MNQNFKSDHAPEPVGPYPHAKRVGDFLFLSGVGPRKKDQEGVPGVRLNDAGGIVSYDFEVQCHAVFTNVRMILENAGAHWEDLIDVTVFLTDIENDFQIFNRIYAEHFPDNKPCRTTVGINGLPTPIAIELKCIAWMGTN